MKTDFSRREFIRLGAAACSGIAAVGEANFHFNAGELSPATLSNLDRVVPSLMERIHVPGLSVALITGGRITGALGWGVKKMGAPDKVTPETVFEAASCSKPVFASIVLRLAAEKTLDLDESLADFFRQPDLANEPRINQITPRIVLSQRTGLQNWRPAQQPLKMKFDPGTGFSYSGESYVRLQRAVEKKTGKTLTELSQTYAFEPLGMKASSYIWKPEYAQTAAEGHDESGKIVRTRLWEYSPTAPQAMRLPPGVDIPMFAVPNAAASLYCTASDYARFICALLDLPRAWKFTEASRKMMFTPAAKVNATIQWGLGWGLSDFDGTHTFWHWGNNGVYRCFVLGSLEKKSGLVMLTNSANGLKLCREVVRAAYGADHPAFSWEMVIS